jgi:hypothetical protein
MTDCEVSEAVTEDGESFEECFGVDLWAVLDTESFKGEGCVGDICSEKIGINPTSQM